MASKFCDLWLFLVAKPTLKIIGRRNRGDIRAKISP